MFKEKAMDTTQLKYEDVWKKICTWDRIKIDFPPHYHDYLELVVIKKGRCIASVDFNDYELNDGDAFLVFPSRIHSYKSSGKEPVANYTFILPRDRFPLFKQFFTDVMPECPVIRGFIDLPNVRNSLECAVKENKNNTPYGEATAAGYISVILGEYLKNTTLVPITGNSTTMEKIISYCNRHFREQISLETMAKELHISKFHISHILNDRMNISLPKLLQRIRLTEACKLLKSNYLVTDAALSSGFGSLRSFNRAFMAEKGITPTEYIKQKKENEGV